MSTHNTECPDCPRYRAVGHPVYGHGTCPTCQDWEPQPTHGWVVSIPNQGTPAEKREAAKACRDMFERFGVAAAIVNAERLEREADEEEQA